MSKSIPRLVGKKEQVCDFVLGQIAAGLQTGEQLWTEHQLAGHLGVSKSTVRKAVEEMVAAGVIYQQQGRGTFVKDHRHPLVQARLGQSVRMIGFVSPYLHDDRFMHDITLGVEEALDHQRFLLVNKHIHVPAFREEDVLPRIARQVHGLILLSSMVAGASQAIGELVAHHYPLVLIDRYLPSLATSYVVTDNVEVGLLATEHLIGLGHRRIAHLTHRHALTSSVDRETGYRVAMQRHGLTPWVEHYEGYDQIEPVLDRWLAEELPTAVFVVNDSLAMNCYHALRRRQVRIPQEVSLVGVDGNLDAEKLEVPLTTIAQPKYQIGFKAAQLLQGLLRGQTVGATGIVLEPRLVVRASTAPPQTAG